MTAPTQAPVTLKLCPFCGGEAALDGTRYGYPASHWVKCGNCGSSTTEHSNRDAATRAWNTRTKATSEGESA